MGSRARRIGHQRRALPRLARIARRRTNRETKSRIASRSRGAITPESTITLIKKTFGGDATFGYTLTGGGGLEPELKITTVNGEGRAIEPGIIPGEYEIKEASLPLNWFFEPPLTCTTTGGAQATPVGATAKIRIPITGGATVTCTYSNVLPLAPIPAPKIETTATSTMLGGTIKDTALLSGLHEPTGEGTLTFHLYSDAGCTVAIPGFSYEIKGIKANGEYDSAAFTPEKLGKYYWRVVFSGDVNNDPETSPCNAPGEVSEVTQAQPAISTVATESVRIGEPIKDTAEITGLVKPTGTGTITFRLYSDERCTVPVPGFSSPSEKVTENRSFTSAEFPTANAGLHYWIAEFSGDDNNKAVKTQCRDGDEVSLVREAQPAIKTSATATAIVGQTIEDTATLEGLVSAEGTGAVTFKLFDNDECKGTPVHEFTTASGISGSGTQPVSSDKFTTAKAGTYFWIASFAGDNNNNPIASKCLDPKESSDVVPTTPKIKTSATASAIVGQTLEDTATLEGLVNAEGTGKVTFKLFDNGDCEGTPVHEFTTATGISGSGTQNVSSDEFTTAKTGTYFWIASFAGDKNNDPIASKCLDANESSDVDKALPKVTTAATVEVASVGDKIKDVATLSGLVNPDGTGKVTFRLYSNHNCEGAPLFESTNPSPGGISANGPVSSDEHAIEAPGTYFWVASYSGDAHNKPASTGCGEVGESTVVEQAQPGITTSATSMQVVGGKIKDIATLSGLVKPTGTGTVTFKLYRDSECKSEVFSSTSSGIVTNGPVPSGEYPANAAGTYFWVASYSGDAHNRGVSSGCAAEPVVVDPAIPSLTTTPEPTSGVVGTTFKDKAVIGGLFGTQPGGRVSWTLYSKNDCSGKVASEGPISVSGNGGYSTPAGARPAKTGTYYWVVSYSGDANNRAVSSACAAEPIVAVDPGRASAHGPQACIATTAPVYVTGREIRSVTFYMDGPRRRIRTVAHSDKKGRYLIRIAARELSSHVHRVEMVVVFEPRSKTKPKTLRVLVARCPPPAPVFTG